MCKAIEDMRNEAVRESSLDTARILLEGGKNTLEEIAAATHLSVAEVRGLDVERRTFA